MDEYKTFAKSRALRLKDFDYSNPNYVYFLTIRTKSKHQYFMNVRIAKVVVETIKEVRTKLGFRLYAWCLMPDHLHLLASPSEGTDIRDIVRNIKGISAAKLRRQGLKQVWQKSFYDHVIRKEESLIETVKYILDNPIRKGLTKAEEEYPYRGIVDELPL